MTEQQGSRPTDTPLSALLARRTASMRSSAVRDLLHDARRPGMLSLAGGLPAPDLFDVDGLRAAAASVFDQDAGSALQYGTTEGEPALRAVLAARLRDEGARVDDEQPIITTGSQQGLDLVARALLDGGDLVFTERPGYLAALQVFRLAEARCVGVVGDQQGMRVDLLDQLIADQGGSAPKFVYVVTNFANPTGATLSVERRLRLLQWAVRTRAFILEDDPYGALRVEGEMLPSLLTLAPQVPGASRLCGYLSSLSKTIAPGLRIGYAVLPDWLRQAVVRTKQALDLHTSTLTQLIAARYLASGALRARLPSMRAAYRERRDALCSALRDAFGDRLAFECPQGGMFVWARFTDGTQTTRLLDAAKREGMIFVPGEAFFDEKPDASSLRLSFATATPDQLVEAVARLKRAHAAAGSGDPALLAMRDACVQAALDAWEDAGIRGLCAEGRWEVAIGAMRSLKSDAIANKR